MARIASPASSSERFILPCSSLKIRRFTIFSAIAVAVADASSHPTATSTTSPGPISPMTFPVTTTRAWVTRCSTARINRPLASSGRTPPLISRACSGSRLTRKKLGQLRNVVSPGSHHLRALDQIGFLRLIESVGLRVMRFKILCGVLHTEKSRNACFFEGSVIAAGHPSFGYFQQTERMQRSYNSVHHFAVLIIPHQANAYHAAG